MSDELRDCYECGDGAVCELGEWRHLDDSIGVDGKRVISDCKWGKPFPPVDTLDGAR